MRVKLEIVGLKMGIMVVMAIAIVLVVNAAHHLVVIARQVFCFKDTARMLKMELTNGNVAFPMFDLNPVSSIILKK